MKIKQFSYLAMTLLVTSCGKDGPAPTTPAGNEGGGTVGTVASPTYSSIRQNIFQTRCFSCHSAPINNGGVNLETYESLLNAASTHGHAIVVPGNPDGSHIIEVLRSGVMPLGGPKLTPEEIQTIADWIKAGAQSN